MLAVARLLRCSACEEANSSGVKPVSASHEHREPWKVVGCDMAEWNFSVFETRTVHLWICVDEAAKFTVGHVWADGQQVGNIDGSRVMELLQGRWISVFGRMHTPRTDPEGAWRNKEVHDRLSDMQIVLELHPGEAAWQASVTENTFGIVKDTMTKIALERLHLFSVEVFGNDTPDPSSLEHLQGMETARDAWLNARNEERLKRASRARNRPVTHFRPGDELDFWRRGKGKGPRPHIKGRVSRRSCGAGDENGNR